MRQLLSEGIILARTDYGEADRILTILTPDHGKLRLLAKGVRRVKSKLAGGIELFSISDIMFIPGRGEIGTLVSTRLSKYYAHIVQDLDRTMLGYDLIKQLNKGTEDHPEPEYFNLLAQAFEALDDAGVPLPVIRLWFTVQLIRLAGHTPNLQTDTAGAKLASDKAYHFDYGAMAFRPTDGEGLGAPPIKFLRLAFAGHSAKVLAAVQGSERLAASVTSVVATMLQSSQ